MNAAQLCRRFKENLNVRLRLLDVAIITIATSLSSSCAFAQIYPRLGFVQIVGQPVANEPGSSIFVSGFIDTNSQTTHASFLRVDGHDLLLDVLIRELKTPTEPPVGGVFTGGDGFTLPGGLYTLTTRTFVDRLDGFPDPWTFPDTYSTTHGRGPTDTLTIQFFVIPEPGACVLVAAAVLILAVKRRIRRAT